MPLRGGQHLPAHRAPNTAASSHSAFDTTWCSDWCAACTRAGPTRAAIGSTLLRPPGSSSPVQQARAGPTRLAWPSTAVIPSRYAANRASPARTNPASGSIIPHIQDNSMTQLD